MTMRPPVFSKRFFAVACAAAVASPSATIGALWQLLRGKRLRAWNLLCVEAAQGPRHYAGWIATTEPTLIASWCDQAHGANSDASVLAVVVDRDGASTESHEATRTSLQRTFGSSVTVVRLGTRATITDILAQVDSALEWILPIYAGDTVASPLGPVFAAARVRAPDSRAWFWDEDRIAEGKRADPWIKPSWDPLLFGACGGLLGASVVHRSALKAPESGLDDLDDAALVHSLAALKAGRVGRIPLIMTHRAKAQSANRRLSLPAPESWPSVSLIIPMRDKPDLLRTCMSGLARLEYPGRVETIIIDNGSTDPEALDMLAELAATGRAIVLRDPGPFNYSRLNNLAVGMASGELLCLLNNDIEPLDGSWLTNMVVHAVQPDSGAVGALLLYPDGTVQHAGVAIGLGNAAGHVQRGVLRNDPQHWHWAFATRQVSAVTGACLVVARDRYLAVGGLDEEAFAVAFNDVDLCLKLTQMGLRNVYVAEACLIHHESRSRGLDDVPEKAARFARELRHLQQRWNTVGADDPHFSPLFSRASERCVLLI